MKDIFAIDIFEENGDGDKGYTGILDTNINEGADVSIPVPGGMSETPSAKPYDATSISIPSKTTITADQYNCTITSLKNSFKEASEVLAALEGVQIVDKSIEQMQMEFTEACIDEALLTSLENGPLYEAVKSEDKDAIKEIVLKLRTKIQSVLKEDGITFYKPNIVARCITAVLTTAGAGAAIANLGAPAIGAVVSLAGASNIAASAKQIYNNRLWQVIGIIHSEHGTNLDIAKKLTEKFKDELGEYKILTAEAEMALYDMFKTKFGWKSNSKAYFLVVDKKLPSEIKSMQKEIAEALKKKDSTKDDAKDDKKDDDKK